MRAFLNIDELIIKSVIFVLYLMTQDNNVLLIFPAELFSEVYLAYGLLGSLLFTAFTFWWSFDKVDDEIEMPVKKQIYKIIEEKQGNPKQNIKQINSKKLELDPEKFKFVPIKRIDTFANIGNLHLLFHNYIN